MLNPFRRKQKAPPAQPCRTERIQIHSRIIISRFDNDENYAGGFIGNMRDFHALLVAQRKLLFTGVERGECS